MLIVEGDAENILIPAIAGLIGHDLTESGVSIVNVGGVGMRRYARIFQRKNVEQDGEIDVPVACLADLDVMPDCAPVIVGKVKPEEEWPEGRRWKVKADFGDGQLNERRQAIRERASGQRVDTFVSDHWTLEYDLAFAGLGRELYLAIALAAKDEDIASGKVSATCRHAPGSHRLEVACRGTDIDAGARNDNLCAPCERVRFQAGHSAIPRPHTYVGRLHTPPHT